MNTHSRSHGVTATRTLQETIAREDRIAGRWGPNPMIAVQPEGFAQTSPIRHEISPRRVAAPQVQLCPALIHHSVVNGMEHSDSVSPGRRAFHHVSPSERQKYYASFIAKPSPSPRRYYD
jgi:hypothetical protein